MKLQNMKKKRGTTEITSEGQIRNFGTEQIPQRLCSNINYSSILSRLIVEAGKRCEAYASDLFISWESMLNDISKIEENTNLTYYFGFRDMGVDHELFIQTRLDSPEAYGEKPFESPITSIVDGETLMKRRNRIMIGLYIMELIYAIFLRQVMGK